MKNSSNNVSVLHHSAMINKSFSCRNQTKINFQDWNKYLNEISESTQVKEVLILHRPGRKCIIFSLISIRALSCWVI